MEIIVRQSRSQNSPFSHFPPPPNPLLHSNHVLSLVKHPNPIGYGMATEAIVEAAGPDCIVPGQTVSIKLLGLKVWPVEVDLNFLQPVGRELKLLRKFMDNAVTGDGDLAFLGIL